MTFIPFSQILGQDRAVKTLKMAMAKNKIPHAYLFCGTSGVGKTTAAIALTQALNCKDRVNEEGCGICPSCRQVETGNFVDFNCLEPEGNYIKIGKVRELTRSFGFKPVSGKYRVSVIREADKMTEESANAFLKTLEEPPEGNVMILNVADPLDLLPTIVSRCRKVVFKPIAVDIISQRLMAADVIDEKQALLIAKLSEGSIGRAVKMKESGFIEKREEFLSIIIELNSLKDDQALGVAVEIAKKFKKKSASKNEEAGILDLLSVWKGWFRDLMVIKIDADESNLINIDFSHKLKDISKKFNVENLIKSFSILDKAQRDILRNRNLELLMENTVLSLRKFSKGEAL